LSTPSRKITPWLRNCALTSINSTNSISFLVPLLYDRENTVETAFNLASVGKMFTGVAVAQLAEQGRLCYDDTIAKYLPDYPNPDAANRVTIHELLTHTSGLQDFLTPQFLHAAKNEFVTIQSFFPLFASQPLVFAPGEKFNYTNADYMVLGAIIEKVSNQSYFDYVREHIFEPAGMLRTDFSELDRELPNRATSTTRATSLSAPPPESGPPRNAAYLILYKGMPAGGSFSTVGDLLAFANALLNRQLLNAADTNLVLAGKVNTTPPFPPGDRYAYGFEDFTSNGIRIVGHGGTAPGAVTRLDIFVDKGYVAVTLGNRDYDLAPRVIQKIRDLLTAK
jgi:CubicO group peptidase (beta-lactamase class C family)